MGRGAQGKALGGGGRAKAADALIIGDESVGDIGASVGYPNLLHFSRAFKGVYGMSPREYRQKNKIIDR